MRGVADSRAAAAVRIARAAGLAVVLAAASTACAPKVRLSLPAGEGTPISDIAPVEAAARASCRAPDALTADLRLSGRIDGERVRGTLQVGVARDAMRLEGLAPFGAPVFVIAARPSEAVLLLPRETAVARAPSASDLLDAVVGVPLSPADLLAIVSGCGLAAWEARGGARFGEDWARLDVDDGRRLWLRSGRTSGGGRGEATGPGGSGVPVIVAAEDGRWRIEYVRDGAGWPTAIRLQGMGAEARRTDAVFAVDAPEALDALPSGALDVDVPAGARSISLQDLRTRRDLADR